MALKEAIELIVDQMLEEAKDLEGVTDAASSYTRSTLRGYARQLKTALKAAETPQGANGPTPPNQMPMGQMQPFMLSPEIQRAVEVEKHRAEFKNKHAHREEDFLGGDLVELVEYPGWDPSIPEYIPTPSGGQVGQKIVLPAGVFRLRRRDGKLVLVYDEVETQMAKESLGGDKKSEGGIILGS